MLGGNNKLRIRQSCVDWRTALDKNGPSAVEIRPSRAITPPLPVKQAGLIRGAAVFLA